MKKLITCLAILITVAGFAQNKTVGIEKNIDGHATFVDGKIKLEKMSISVTVDSVEELKTTFTTKGIKEVLDMVEKGEEISFKIICNGKEMSNGLKTNISYSIKRNSDNKKDFIKGVEEIRVKAINFYKSKQ
jgi:hypothetical protein